jgi:hypothetical protein
MASRVVAPNDRRIPISHGDWVLLKDRLNAGEHKRMLRRGTIGGRFDGIEAGTAKVLAYLLDWSVKGLDGKPIPIQGKGSSEVESALDSIDPDSYSEILRAVETHETAMDAERDAEKNGTDGATTSSALSPSRSSAAGDTSGSQTSTVTCMTS